MSDAPAIALQPEVDPRLVSAIERGGGRVVALEEARALVWTGGPDGFPELPDQIEWVALKIAGIEAFFAAGILDDRRTWTNASGFYAAGCAEHALALLLAGLRQIGTAVLLGWSEAIDPAVRTLRGSTVTILGAGGIGRELTPRLSAMGARVIAVNRSGRPVAGADRTLPINRLDEVWAQTDHLVLTAAATAETRHIINDETLARLKPHSWLVNVARGTLIDQAALGRALRAGTIAGAALDVTNPEPPADDDLIWTLPNLIITPHVANPASRLIEEFAPYLEENVRRFTAGTELVSVVNRANGY